MSDDGSTRAFGQNTVASLTSSNASDAAAWAGRLTNQQLRGLVHEVGQRLLEGSQLYHARLAQLERIGEDANYRFFGLQPGASEKDLDNAYRRLARQWHPDKNGGTEEAKQRFQNMKERYEALKKRREEAQAAQGDSGGRQRRGRSKERQEEDDGNPQNNQENEEQDDDHQSAKSDGGDADVKEEGSGDVGTRLSIKDGDKPSPLREDKPREKSAVDSDDEDECEDRGRGKKQEENEAKTTSIEYDPSDKDSMVRTVSRMVKQLKNIEIQMKVLVKELSRAQSSFP
jgi:curved DNA-binding protein CbpA